MQAQITAVREQLHRHVGFILRAFKFLKTWKIEVSSKNTSTHGQIIQLLLSYFEKIAHMSVV